MGLLEQITPPAMRDRLDTLCQQRPDIRVTRHLLGEARILEWVHSVGTCGEDGLRSLVPPFPPVELRRVTGASDLEEFLWTGMVDLENFLRLYEEHRGPATPRRPAILDFGCGCGRMTRFLSACPQNWKVCACDVNPDHVGWCQENLKGVRTVQNKALPPSPFGDGDFDLVYGMSVFTHLPEHTARRWLNEMHRILVPGGLLIVTTHGLPALEIIKGSEAHRQMFGLSREESLRIAQLLAEAHFVFLPYGHDTLEAAKAGDEYGNTIVHPEYIGRHWENEGFKVLRHLPGGLRNWQDIVILQRKA